MTSLPESLRMHTDLGLKAKGIDFDQFHAGMDCETKFPDIEGLTSHEIALNVLANLEEDPDHYADYMPEMPEEHIEEAEVVGREDATTRKRSKKKRRARQARTFTSMSVIDDDDDREENPISRNWWNRSTMIEHAPEDGNLYEKIDSIRLPEAVADALDEYRSLPPEERADVPFLYWLTGGLGTPDFKMDKDDALYGEPPGDRLHERCSNCTFTYKHYTSGEKICSMVDGPIALDLWCRLYAPYEG